MDQKKYWQSLGELKNSEAYEKSLQNEFAEDLPVEQGDESLLEAKAPRRDFLKYLGFSTAAAMAAASCEIPVKKAIPYLNKPDNLVPGIADYFASTYVQDDQVVPVIVKVRDGRPIKIEGNELSSWTKGGTSARVQASVLSIYDTARLRYPMQASGEGFKEVTTFEAFDKLVGDAMAGIGNAPVVLLTSGITSRSTKKVIGEFLAKYPGSRHVEYEALSYSGMLLANEATFGRKEIPMYHLDAAKVIVSLDADFLGTWLAPVTFARQYSTGRKVNPEKPEMSKHIQFESRLSLTGANADDRFIHRPSEIGMVALNLLSLLGGGVSAPAVADARLKKGLEMAANMLKQAGGNGVVVSGSNDVHVQILVNAINQAIGAYGKTINWGATINTAKGSDKEMVQLVKDMNAGAIGAVLIHGVNPAYDYYDAKGFTDGLKKVKVSVSFNDKEDETTQLCKFVIPDHNFLESWGDAEPVSGHVSFIQPTIAPLFKTRAFQTSLLKWSGNNTEYAAYMKAFWLTALGSQEAFDKALQDGVLETQATVSAGSYSSAALAAAATAASSAKKGGKTELVIYQKNTIGSGKDANNPWLQELPDPITKATWDNYAIISYAMAKEMGIALDDLYEVEVTKPVINLKVNGKEMKLPILAIPGMHPNVIAVAVGYGRTEKVGRAAANVGTNVYPLVGFNGTTFDYSVASVEVEKTKEVYKVAYTQTHNQYEGRTEVVKEYSIADFRKNTNVVAEVKEKLAEDYAKKTGDYAAEGTLYPSFPYPGPKWGMSIDLNSCIGCGACSVACTVENNVAVVGKSEVLRMHEMHWLRIDRYFATYRDDSGNDDLDNLNVVFMPMLCQHCDNAPCENVCPVAATNHSSEGINQMTYNRCIGTRYCANNCPYKVRRFNWADYTGADSFPNNRDQQLVGKLDPVVEQMNDELTRMVLNPDVTVRSRGVIEKCSFCFQRLQAAKLEAKKANRPLQDGEAKTACQTACAANAIVFGNVNDPNSAITAVRASNTNRSYYVLEQLHVLPNVSYLAKVRNTDEVLEVEEHHAAPAAHGTETKHETAKPEAAHH